MTCKDNKRKRHINEFMRTSFKNSGRIAGMGVLYDKYDEESGGPVYGENNVRVVTPCDFLSPAERRELSGPVKTYKLKVGCVEDCPTIDAVPVVRGEWKTNSNYPDKLICSVCGYKEDMWWADKGTNYCPNCGAKMEVEP